MSDQTPPSPGGAPEIPAETEDLGFQLPSPAKGSRIGVLVGVVVVVGAGLTFGYLRYRKAHGEPLAGAEVIKPPRVELIKPTVLSSDLALTLPGTVRPLEETKIYARVTGYVRSWKVDIGDKVTAGQLLAEIDTPDLAADLAQARAQLASARANVKQAGAQRDYSKGNSARYVGLADQHLISKAQVEEQQAKAATDEATVSATESSVTAMEANVRRLTDLAGFSKIVAPFAGTVTTRAIERGALIREGATVPLYTIVAIDPVRIYLDVPQSIATAIRNDTPAIVTVREYGSRAFTGKVTRFAGALDPDSHTMTTEIQVPNPDGVLFPGMYVQAAIKLPTPHKILEVPATALYSDANGVRLAVVDATHKVKLTKITIERDTGGTVYVATGITGDEQIVKIAIPTLLDGDTVDVGK